MILLPAQMVHKLSPRAALALWMFRRSKLGIPQCSSSLSITREVCAKHSQTGQNFSSSTVPGICRYNIYRSHVLSSPAPMISTIPVLILPPFHHRYHTSLESVNNSRRLSLFCLHDTHSYTHSFNFPYPLSHQYWSILSSATPLPSASVFT
jgi:hypothetical protein